MSLYKKIILIAVGSLVTASGFLLSTIKEPTKLQGQGGVAATECSTASTTRMLIGNQSARVLLATSSPARAWARIQQPYNATNSVFLQYNQGKSATVNDFLLGANGTSSQNHIDFGLNTDFPYSGSVTGITDVGSTTVLVTECKY